MDEDFTTLILDWMSSQFEPHEALAATAGLLLGLSVASRHSDYAEMLYAKAMQDYKTRLTGSPLLFQAMAIASGDERSGVESLADDLTAALPL